MTEETTNNPIEQPEGNGSKKNGDNKKDGAANGKQQKFPPLSGFTPPETSKDPIIVLKEILADKDLNADEKEWLLNYSVTRFKNRRRMAYWSLTAILASLAFLLLGSVYDGMIPCVADKTCTGILANLSSIKGLLQWIEGFLAAIVATYYGVSSFRPSS